jgi:hypothetical protein
MVDYGKLFGGMAILLIGIVAFVGLGLDFNTAYGTELGNDINGTTTALNSGIYGNLSVISGNVGNAANPEEGQGSGGDSESLGRRALRIIQFLPDLMGLPMAVLRDFGAIFGVPSIIIDVAVFAFIFAFVLTLAYLLLLGVGKFT